MLIMRFIRITMLTGLTCKLVKTEQGVSKEDLEKAGASLQAASVSAVVTEEPTPVPVTSAVDRLSTSFQDHRSMSLTDEVRCISQYLVVFACHCSSYQRL